MRFENRFLKNAEINFSLVKLLGSNRGQLTMLSAKEAAMLAEKARIGFLNFRLGKSLRPLRFLLDASGFSFIQRSARWFI